MRIIAWYALLAAVISATLVFPCSAQQSFSIDNVAEADVQGIQACSAKGDVECQTKLALLLQQGRYLNPNAREAARLLMLAAQAGFVPAQNGLGMAYQMGWGVERDSKLATDWYKKAARAGYPPAQFNLGALYYNGDTPETSEDNAQVWWTIAAESGDKQASMALIERGLDEPRATLQVAHRYLNGVGIDSDVQAGIKYLKQSARVLPEAQLALARLYLDGRLIEKSEGKASELINRAVKAGFAPAEVFAGDTELAHGQQEKALLLFQRAAGRAHAAAFARLGAWHQKGQGGKVDVQAAAMYYMIGESLGSRECSTALKALNLSPEDTKDAVGRALKWLQRGPNVAVLAEVRKRMARPTEQGAH